MDMAEEDVILWVTSDLCNSTSVPSGSVEGTVSTSAIPVTLFRSHENINETVSTLQYEDVKDAQQYCVMEEEISVPKEKKSRKRGAVWNYFVPTVPDRAQCSFCPAVISYKGKSTNNLLRHLRTKHSENASKIEETKVESCLAEDGSTYYVLASASAQPSSPANSNSSFQAIEETEQNKRRGGVWKYFSTDSAKRAKCKICGSIISFKGGSTTNLLRHMKSKHTDIRVRNKMGKPIDPVKLQSTPTVSSLQHSFAEIVNECVKSDDENEFQTINTIHFNPTADVSDNLTVDDKDGLENITILSSMDPNFSQDIDIQEYNDTNECIETKVERKKSAIAWNYFTMEENDERAKCSTCSAVISFKGGSTGNLLRHLKTKHSEIDLTPPPVKLEPSPEEDSVALETIENKELAKFIQLLNPKYKLQGVQVPRLNDKDVPKRVRKRGAALSYFELNSEEDIGTCQLCNATVNLKNGSKAPLLRHLKAKHSDLLVSEVTINNDIENIENIPMHCSSSDLPKQEKMRKMRKRGLVWNHFAPLEDEKAKCITCPAVISYKRGSTSNLLRHMKKKHPEIDVRDEDSLKGEQLAESAPSEDEDDDDDYTPEEAAKPTRKVLRKRGRVWNFFKPTAPDKAKCSLCNVIVVYLKGSTTNLLRHMKKKHSQIDLSKEKPFNKRLTYPREKSSPSELTSENESILNMITSGSADETSLVCASSSPSVSSTSDKTNAIYRRSEIIFRKHFDKFLNRPVSVTKSKLYDEQLAKMIVKQICPFTIVENDDFKKLVQTVNPGYSLPSRKTISSRLIPELYEKCVEEVRERLSNIKYVTITANGWTIMNNECYISITVYFIDDECKLESNLLDCFKYDETNTAENLETSFKMILTDWGVIHKVNAVVSDNSANIAAAIRLSSWGHIPCFANIINLIVHCGLVEMREILEKTRLIAEHFKINQQASRKLNSTLKEMNLPETKLKPDDPTKWVSTYELISQLVECRVAIVASLDPFVENLAMLNEYEWNVLLNTCTVLKPLLDITNEVSEKNVTISKVIPLSRCIAEYLRKTLQDPFLVKELASIVEKMLAEVTLRFGDVEDNILLAESTFLDPRFKNQAFTNNQSYSKAYHSILQNACSVQLGDTACAFAGDTAHDDKYSQNISTTSVKDESNIWEEFDSRVIRSSDVQNPETAAATEMENYIQEPLINRNADPLLWWRDRKSLYPRLFEIMKQRLCIAATAVSKDFTNSGQLVYEKRNKLSPSKVSMVLFLNHNL